MDVFAGIIESATLVSFLHCYTYYWYLRLQLIYSDPLLYLRYPNLDLYFGSIGILQEVYRAAVRHGKEFEWQCVVFASGLIRRSFQLPRIRSSRAYLHWPRSIPPWCGEYANWEPRRIPAWCGEPIQYWSRRILPSWPHSSWDVVFLRRDLRDRGEQFQKRPAEDDRQPGVQLYPTEKARLSHWLAVFHPPQSPPM